MSTLVDDYLSRLDRALAGLPAERRREIVADVADHIAAGRAGLEPDDEAGLRTLLDRLGDPEQIAADAGGDDDAPPAARGRLETAAIVLLLLGGFVFVAGWLAGVVLLWLSDRWRLRDKLIGTLVVPGGLALPLFLASVGAVVSTQACTGITTASGSATMHCTGGTPVWEKLAGGALIVALAAASIGAAAHLARRSR